MHIERHHGAPVFPGLAMARTQWLRSALPADLEERASLGADAEWSRFEAAMKRTEEQLAQIRSIAEKKLGASEAAIFEAHLMMVQDPEFTDGVKAAIDGGATAELAIRDVTATFVKMLSQAPTEYLRERVADLQDVTSRLTRNLGTDSAEDAFSDPVIVVAEDLAPSDLIGLADRPVRGVALVKGGLTSHAAILLKSMGIPSVFGLGSLGQELRSRMGLGPAAILDANKGDLILNPPDSLRGEYEVRSREDEGLQKELITWKHQPTRLASGEAFPLCANVGNQAQLEAALAEGAEGVGLYRTEFLFMDRSHPPTEDEQTEIYTQALKSLAGRPLTIRTLDIGGDKKISYLQQPTEENPFLGVRGLRLCLQERALFETQLRALIRASEHGPLEVMFPMVTLPTEVEEALEIVRPLMALKKPNTPPIRWGMMLEVPANLFTIPELSRHVEFFSVGTNDLIQYLTASDRMNPDLSRLGDPFSPSVLRALAFAAKIINRQGRSLSVCGELAAEPLLAPFLLGIGVDKLSMNPLMIARHRRRFAKLNRAEAQRRVEAVLAKEDPSEVRRELETWP